jgi:putative membrane protein
MPMTHRCMSPRVALALLLAGAVGACKGKDQYSGGEATMKPDSTAPAKVDTTASSAVAPMAPSMSSTSGWTSPTILGFAVVANSGEVELGKLGETKATAPAIKAFAKQMVTDHRAMLSDVKALATKVGATADTTADNARDLMNHARDEIKDLSEKKAGTDWDNDYIDKMIDDHQKVLDKLQDASKNTTDPTIRPALERATGKVQEHLTKAQDIKARRKA